MKFVNCFILIKMFKILKCSYLNEVQICKKFKLRKCLNFKKFKLNNIQIVKLFKPENFKLGKRLNLKKVWI
jgi:hypothetical protein